MKTNYVIFSIVGVIAIVVLFLLKQTEIAISISIIGIAIYGFWLSRTWYLYTQMKTICSDLELTLHNIQEKEGAVAKMRLNIGELDTLIKKFTKKSKKSKKGKLYAEYTGKLIKVRGIIERCSTSYDFNAERKFFTKGIIHKYNNYKRKNLLFYYTPSLSVMTEIENIYMETINELKPNWFVDMERMSNEIKESLKKIEENIKQ